MANFSLSLYNTSVIMSKELQLCSSKMDKLNSAVKIKLINTYKVLIEMLLTY